MKTLLVYYSRTGHTEKEMKRLAELVRPERCIKIRPKRPREGFAGLLRCVGDMFGGACEIEPHDVPPVMEEYDLVIVGTPVWGGGVSGPVKAFVNAYGKGVQKYALVESSGGPASQDNRTVKQLDRMTGLACASVVTLPGKFTAEERERALAGFAAALGL